MGEIDTICQEVGNHDLHRIGLSEEWKQAVAIDEQGKIIREMRVLSDSNSLKGFRKNDSSATL